jgi:hypothetical protein
MYLDKTVATSKFFRIHTCVQPYLGEALLHGGGGGDNSNSCWKCIECQRYPRHGKTTAENPMNTWIQCLTCTTTHIVCLLCSEWAGNMNTLRLIDWTRRRHDSQELYM